MTKLIRDLNGFQIKCECGNVFGADKMTECKRCGAHYELELTQTAPPIGSER